MSNKLGKTCGSRQHRPHPQAGKPKGLAMGKKLWDGRPRLVRGVTGLPMNINLSVGGGTRRFQVTQPRRGTSRPLSSGTLELQIRAAMRLGDE
jgi:hypothetical protein